MKPILQISIFFCALCLSVNAQNKILVKLAQDLKGPYTGRLLVYTQADTSKPFGQSKEEGPAFAIEVKNWKQGENQSLDQKSFAYLKTLDELKKGYYKLVAILDTNTKERSTSAPGNLYTRQEVVAKFDGGVSAAPVLTLSNVFPERKFNQNDTVKEVVLQSALLTKFRKEAVFLKAGILLPPSYKAAADRKYPVVYVIPGWGGTHHHAYNKGQQQTYGYGKGEEKIYVFLNPENQTPYGLHAFIDSRVNGPWGTAIVKELIPYLENNYNISKLPEHRLITGQSSGGYGAIWLSLHFPAEFGGCWATAPDPIDFTNFTGVNIYKDNNFFTDDKQQERGIFMVNGQPTSTLRKMNAKEQLEGDGGQEQSFEAAFGEPDRLGRPKPLFDARTGKIDKTVANSWKPYDLSLYVLQHWSSIKKNAANKIRIYAGENDNFYLQNSALAFADKIKGVQAQIQVKIIKGADHFTTRSIIAATIQKEMDETINKKPMN